MMTAQLLKYVRSIFLAMVRVRYWHDIEQGKLPRKSKSAKFLLYSIEVGQEDAGKEEGIMLNVMLLLLILLYVLLS